MEFFEAVRLRRSVRRFKPDPVSEPALRAMLDAARMAPSATNTQPWHFIVIRDKAVLDQLQAMVDAMAETRQAEARNDDERKQIQVLAPFSRQFEAPVAIAVLGRVRNAQVYFEPSLQSVAAAVAQLHLAATALGYGCCWATGPVAIAGDELESLLGVERPWRLMAVVSVGAPDEKPWHTTRKPLDEITTFIG